MILTIDVNGPDNRKYYSMSRSFSLPFERRQMLEFAQTWGAYMSQGLVEDLCRMPMDTLLSVDYGSQAYDSQSASDLDGGIDQYLAMGTLPRGYPLTQDEQFQRLYASEDTNKPHDWLCSHEYVDVGFQFSKYVCKKCGHDKPVTG